MTYTHKDFADALEKIDELGSVACLFEIGEPIVKFALQALSDPNWKLVPIDPNRGMIKSCRFNDGILGNLNPKIYRKSWNAMISAAPPYTKSLNGPDEITTPEMIDPMDEFPFGFMPIINLSIAEAKDMFPNDAGGR